MNYNIKNKVLEKGSKMQATLVSIVLDYRASINPNGINRCYRTLTVSPENRERIKRTDGAWCECMVSGAGFVSWYLINVEYVLYYVIITQSGIYELQYATCQTIYQDERDESELEPDASELEHDASGLEHDESGPEPDASDLEHDASGLEHGASGLEHDAIDLEHGASGLEHNASVLEHDYDP